MRTVPSRSVTMHRFSLYTTTDTETHHTSTLMGGNYSEFSWTSLRPCNDRALNRDLALLCERVNEAAPRLPDGRQLSFTIRSTCCMRASRKKPLEYRDSLFTHTRDGVIHIEARRRHPFTSTSSSPSGGTSSRNWALPCRCLSPMDGKSPSMESGSPAIFTPFPGKHTRLDYPCLAESGQTARYPFAWNGL